MARAFAAMGRDLALCARRVDRLDELKAELTQRYPEHHRGRRRARRQRPRAGAQGVRRAVRRTRRHRPRHRQRRHRQGRPTGLGQAVGEQGHHRDQSRRGAGSGRDRAGDVQEGRLRTPRADLQRAGQQGCARSEGRLRGQQGRGVIAGRVTARRICFRPNQSHGSRTGLHRVGDDGEVELHHADGRQRDRCAADGESHRTRDRPRDRSRLAVGAAGDAAASCCRRGSPSRSPDRRELRIP